MSEPKIPEEIARSTLHTLIRIADNLPERDAFSIQEFCSRHSISQSTYFALREQGDGPTEIRVGAKVLISREAAFEWRKKHSAQSDGVES